VFAAVFLACNAFGSSGDDATQEPHDSGVPPKETTDTGAPPQPDAAADAETAPACATPVTIKATGTQDVGLVACDQANSYGSDNFMNISSAIGPGILRVAFSEAEIADLAAALQKNPDAITNATLTLTANPMCGDQCKPSLPTMAGAIVAHAARNDWQEGVSGAVTSPDRCRRVLVPDTGWGNGTRGTRIAATADYEAHPNQAALLDNASSVDIPITPADFSKRSEFIGGQLSFFIEAPSGRMIVGTHESATPPVFSVTYCKQ
jgi:hypothetical protein